MLHELYIISGNVFTMFVFSEASVVYWQDYGSSLSDQDLVQMSAVETVSHITYTVLAGT